jgi:hypothetical protein
MVVNEGPAIIAPRWANGGLGARYSSTPTLANGSS